MDTQELPEDIIARLEKRVEGFMDPEKADPMDKYFDGIGSMFSESLLGYNFKPVKNFLNNCQNEKQKLLELQSETDDVFKAIQIKILNLSISKLNDATLQIKKPMDLSNYVSMTGELERILNLMESFASDDSLKSQLFLKERAEIMGRFSISEEDLIKTKELDRQIEESIRKQEERKEKAPKFLKWLYK